MSVESITKSLNETTMRVADIERRLQDDNLRFEKTDSKIGRFEEKLNTLTSTVESIDHKTDELIQKPSKRYEAMTDKVVFTILGIVIAFLAKSAGIF